MKNIEKICILILLFSISENVKAQDNCDQSNKIIYSLAHINHQTFPDSLGIATIDSAFSFIINGDTEIFSAILELTKNSDAALSQYLGMSLGALIIDNTKMFLELACGKSKIEQDHLGTFAFYMDGGGMSDDEYQIVENNLNELLLSDNIEIVQTSKRYMELLASIRKEVKL